jgi:hypothetical protein
MSKDTASLVIDIDSPYKLGQRWPPSPILILLLSIPMASYPLWVVILTKYRDECPPLPTFLVIPLNVAASWVLDLLPNLVLQTFFWYIIVSLVFVGLWHLGFF